MKLYILFWVFVGHLGSFSAVRAEGLGTPDQSALEQQVRLSGVLFDGPLSYVASDYDIPKAGMVRQFERKCVNQLNEQIGVLLLDLPQDVEWRKEVETVAEMLATFEKTGARNDLLVLIPSLLSGYKDVSLAFPSEGSARSIYQGALMGLAQLIHAEVFILVKSNNGVVSDDEWELVSEMVLYGALWEMGSWEYRSDYISSPGGFLMDEDRALEDLMAAPIDKVNSFLGAHRLASGFFSRYEPDGDGMEVLKEKYATNKEVIHSKFAEVVDHLKELEAAEGSGG